MDHINELKRKAVELRLKTLDTVYNAGGGHIGGDFSSIDILTVLYYSFLHTSPQMQDDPERDRFILSKGHSVEGYYAVLCDQKYITQEMLDTYSKFGSKLIGHPSKKVPGMEFNTGALGHGLSVAVGMALGAKKCGSASRVCVLMGDGELAEGSVWEAAMAASNYRLDNLIAIIDRNGLQISGTTEDVMQQEDLAARWRAFGFYVLEVNGNDISQLLEALDLAKKHQGGPSLIIAKTTKGKGVSFMENKAVWHHKCPSKEEYEQGRKELNSQLEAL